MNAHSIGDSILVPAVLRGNRSGFVLQEAMMAIALALAILVGATQLLATVAGQRRLARQQVVAMQEAGNLMEQIAARRWSEINPEALTSVKLSDACRLSLSDPKLRIDVTSEDQDAKRIRIEIAWQAGSGRPAEPVRLVAWTFRGEEAGP